MMRPIAPGVSRNSELSDAFFALKLLFTPWNYKKGKGPVLLKKKFCDLLLVENVSMYISGRGALYAILTSLGIGPGDEVLVQAFTCVAVVDAILTLGAKPIYADITPSLTLNTKDVSKKITQKTKAIIFQHTFGISEGIEDIVKLAKDKRIFLIEDGAHIIGEAYHNRKIGTYGDAAIFSFGRDKAFSSVWGGIAVVKNKELSKRIDSFISLQEFPKTTFILQALFHPVIFAFFILPFYDFFHFGKFFLVLFQKLHIISKPIDKKSSFGQYIKKFPHSLAVLALFQLTRMERFNNKRKAIANEYIQLGKKLHLSIPVDKNIAFLRFPLLVDNPNAIKLYFRKQNIYLGDWYSHVIDPKETSFKRVYYTKGMCSHAEEVAKHIINLPTYSAMSKNDVQLVIATLTAYAKHARNHK